MMKERDECPVCGRSDRKEFSLLGRVVALAVAAAILVWVVVATVAGIEQLARLF